MLLATLLWIHPSTSYSQNSTPCETVVDCRARLATAKRIAQDAIDKAKKAEAREAEMKGQRDTAIDAGKTCQTDRDHAAKGEADCKTRNLKLESDVAVFIVENTLLQASLKKVKTQRWMLLGAGLVIGLVAGAGGVLWASK